MKTLDTLAMKDLMRGLSVHHIRVSCTAREMISFGAQPGSAIRGGLYAALSRQFCPDTGMRHLPGHASACPVCWLLATEDPTGTRGHDLPRPLTVQPPVGDVAINGGEHWQFGITAIGERAAASLPFLVRAIQELGRTGVGRGRGRFTLMDVHELNPLDDSQHKLLRDGRLHAPANPVRAEAIERVASRLPPDHLTLRFITPLRIGEQKRLAHAPDLGILTRRLLERCQSMAVCYGHHNSFAEDRENWRTLSLELTDASHDIRLVEDRTRWLDVQSGSRRTGTTTPIGGLVGTVTWKGHLAPFLAWMLWGQSLHVGKNTIKGNGWFEVVKG